MSDLRFDDVVDINRMIGPQGKYRVAICKTCSKRHKVIRDDFTHPSLKRLEDGEFKEFVPDEVDEDFLEYVAGMRAWSCCHDGEEPLDGFPEEPELPAEYEFDRNP